MYIKDAVHGYITLNDAEAAVVDTSAMQRLRRVKQLGFTHLVYPSVTHTRFEHSLGACHLAGQFASHLTLSEEQTQQLRMAALLHDIGHGPFSHASERVFARYGQRHEHYTLQKVTQPEIASVLEEAGISVNTVQRYIRGETELGQIIAGSIDVDRMDYLIRDAHYSGVGYGVIDVETIIRAAQFYRNALVFRTKFIQALEGFLITRYLMTRPVYLHEVASRAEDMLERAIEQEIQHGAFTVNALAEMDDIALISALRNAATDTAQYLMRCLDRRHIFVCAYEREQPNAFIADTSDEALTALEEEIAQETQVPPSHIIANSISVKKEDTLSVKVLEDRQIKPLEDISPLVRTLVGPKESTIRVCCPAHEQRQVQQALQSLRYA